MSTLVATTLQDRVSAKRISMEMSVDGTPKSFMGWNGITNVVSTSMNVTSMTDAAVGQWYPNYTSVFSGWSLPSGSVHNSGVFWGFLSLLPSSTTGNSVLAVSQSTPAVPADASHVAMSVCGRLA